jgi:hypothetical protein
MQARCWACILFVVMLFGRAVAAQSPQPAPTPLNARADDAKRMADLAAHGERREGKFVVLFTPAGALPDTDETALVDRLDRGIAELRALVGRHPWQVVGDEKISYYVSPDRFIAHPSGGHAAVFIPLVRVQDGKAPYIHEAAFELLIAVRVPIGSIPPQIQLPSWPAWFGWGLANYLGLTAAARAGFRDGDVFELGGLERVDAVCAERLKGPRGPEILPFVGGTGSPPGLNTTERGQVAPTFNGCSLSFTKHLVDRIGLQQAIALMPLLFETGAIQLPAGTMETMRTEWRHAIGVP